MYVCMGVLVLVSVALGRNLFSFLLKNFTLVLPGRLLKRGESEEGGGGLAGTVTIIIMKACRA